MQLPGMPVTNYCKGSLISDGQGGAIVSWNDYRNDPENGLGEEFIYPEIYAQRIDANGDVLWNTSGIKISNAVKHEANGDPAINIYDDNSGGAVFLWDDKLNGIIYTQRVNSTGDLIYDEDKILTDEMVSDDNLTRDSYFRAIPGANGDNLLVAWVKELPEKFVFRVDNIDIGSGNSIAGLGDGSGIRLADEFEFSEHAGIMPCSFSVANNGASGIIVTWLGGVAYPDNRDGYVYANMLSLNSTLPVEFTDFSIKKGNNGYPLLKWITAQETNSSYFGIERSMDGVNFIGIGKVAAAGNSSIEQSYEYTDASLDVLKSQVVYYRIKQTDLDGKYIYTKTLSYKIYPVFKVTLAENPVRETATLYVVSHAATQYQLYVTDLNGRIVASNKGDITKGINNITIPFSRMAKGMYLMNLNIQGNNTIIKVIKN
ncbi:MAG: T9SS type A sorting domain-containing protein [Chitinophagaceae bacterium]|nr:T9SS type A sorting domain-containing protein [Chitinophagaceae bacterium]